MKKTILAAAAAVFLASGAVGAASATVTVSVQNSARERVEAAFPFDPKRVVAADYAVIDMLQTWGLADRLVGASTPRAIGYLDALSQSVDIGGLKDADLDIIAKLNPELIFITGRLAAKTAEYDAVAPTMFLSPDFRGGALASFEANLRAVAKVFGKEKQAEAEIEGVRARVAAIRAKAEGETAAVLMVNNGRVGMLAPKGRASMISDEFGWSNVISSRPEGAPSKKHAEGTVSTPKEAAQANAQTFAKLENLKPVRIFILNKDVAVGRENPTNFDAIIRANEAVWNKLEAVKNGRVQMLNSAAWYLGEGGPKAMDLMLSDAENALGIR